MPDMAQLGFGVVALALGVGAIFSVVLLCRSGLRLLFWPIRWAVRGTMAATSGLDASVYWAAVVATAFLVTEPFQFALTILMQLVELLAYRLPVAILRFVSLPPPGCQLSRSSTAEVQQCASRIFAALLQFWEIDISALIRSITIPPKLWAAILVFGFCLLLAWAAEQGLATIYRSKAAKSAFYKVTALSLSLLFALYLCVTAAVAIPIFDDKPDDKLEDTAKSLEQQLQKLSEPYAVLISKIAIDDNDVKAPRLNEARDKIASLWKASGTDKASDTTDYSKYYYQQRLFRQLDEIAEPVAALLRAKQQLQSRVNSFSDSATSFAHDVTQYFLAQNKLRATGKLTQRHMALLQSHYQFWLSQFTINLEQCRLNLLKGSDEINSRYAQVLRAVDVSAPVAQDGAFFQFPRANLHL
jgi:hypothetical protein